jgi:hypothetical protein
MFLNQHISGKEWSIRLTPEQIKQNKQKTHLDSTCQSKINKYIKWRLLDMIKKRE